MGRIKKKGTAGQAKAFITRTQAVRKLQISLPDFRRLCIFKGIYPREPRNKRKASKSSTPSTTFYYTKDIQYLLHEPLLAKFRDHNALAKKISKALGKGEVGDAARLERTHKPRMTLDHIVKERYPTFVDALRDLDDALSMLFLFASLPSTHFSIPPKTIALCQRLCHEFEHYLIVSYSLRKSFLSIKGIYYQATIQGQDILWLVPYQFVQRVTNDVDLRIMATFVEFYITLLGFVNYRLYSTAGLVYPPKFNQGSDEEGGALGAFQVQSRDIASAQNATANGDTEATARAQAIANTISTNQAESTSNDNDDAVSDDDKESPSPAATALLPTDFQPLDPTADTLPHLSLSSDTQAALASNLLKSFTFYLSRETPRAPLEFILKAFGCSRIGWDAVLGAGAFTTDEADQRITHQIVDRPPLHVSSSGVVSDEAADEDVNGAPKRGMRYANRTYVQPQWVWDSINAGELQRPDLYAPGATLPPHLSPFVKPKKGMYDPTAPLEEVEEDVEAGSSLLEGFGAEEGDGGKDGDTMNGINCVKDLGDLEDGEGMEVDDGEGSENAELEDRSDVEAKEDDNFGGFSSATDEDSDIDSDTAYQLSLAAEASGAPPTLSPAQKSKHLSTTTTPSATKPTKATRKQSSITKEKQKQKQQRQSEWELERRKMMMTQKKRKLYEKMAYSNKERDEETARLVGKRRRIEGGGAGKTR